MGTWENNSIIIIIIIIIISLKTQWIKRNHDSR